MPVDSFFEWAKTHGKGPKQAYAIGMKTGAPFALAGLWESWQHPETGEIIRSFCIITTTANALIAPIHDRMPIIVPPEAFDRWLSPVAPDPRDLLIPFPADLMRLWPVSARVNSAANDDPGLLEKAE